MKTNLRKHLGVLGVAGLLTCYLGPAAIAAYNAPASYGPLTGDCTTPSSTNPATTCTSYNGGTAFGSGAASVVGVERWSNVTTGSSYSATSTDQNICVNKTTGSATAVTLPTSPATGRTVSVKDCKGDAATNNITVSPSTGTVDGAASYVMNVARQGMSFKYTGSEWSVF